MTGLTDEELLRRGDEMAADDHVLQLRLIRSQGAAVEATLALIFEDPAHAATAATWALASLVWKCRLDADTDGSEARASAHRALDTIFDCLAKSEAVNGGRNPPRS